MRRIRMYHFARTKCSLTMHKILYRKQQRHIFDNLLAINNSINNKPHRRPSHKGIGRARQNILSYYYFLSDNNLFFGTLIYQRISNDLLINIGTGTYILYIYTRI